MSAVKRENTEVVISASTLVLDIEGTTTSISFVKDVLFPYVRKHLEAYLKLNVDGSEEFKKVLDDLKEQAKEDEANKIEGVVAIPDTSVVDDMIRAVVENVVWQMDNDRKTKCLKDLQGLIYEDGYKKGDLKGHVYEDVEPCLKAWTEQGKTVYIYSSGSVAAQKLLFGHSEKGDLLPFIKGHFDTSVGMKGESQSYKNILDKISCSPSEVVFLTDVPKEAKAAKEAGILPLLVTRDGNSSLTEEESSEFQVISSFEEIKFEHNSKKRKLSSENVEKNETENKEINSCSESINSENPEVPETNEKEEKMEVEENGTSEKPLEKTEESKTSIEDSQNEKSKEETAAPKNETVKTDQSVEASSVTAESDDKKVEGTKEDESNSKPEIKDADSSSDKKDETKEADSSEINAKPKEDAKEIPTSSDVTSERDISKDEEKKTEEVTESKEVPATNAKAEDKNEPESTENKTEAQTPESKETPLKESQDETVEGSSQVNSTKETDELGENEKDQTEKDKVPEKIECTSGEVEDSKEVSQETTPVNGDLKTNGADHSGDIPNGKLSNGSEETNGTSPSEKSNGAQVEDAAVGESKSAKAGKLSQSEDTITPVIEA